MSTHKHKRSHTPPSAATTPSHSPTHKASRTAPTEPGALLCTLPPTCTHRPTPLAGTRELERHYATYHAHVCEQPGCSCVFPEARLLELHQTECHDPLAAVRRERGEKIFACHLPPTTCPRTFATPKARRLHLIQAHGYPREYFFAVTNKGVGGLLRRWGEGASMVRGPWRAREGQGQGNTGGGDVNEKEAGSGSGDEDMEEGDGDGDGEMGSESESETASEDGNTERRGERNINRPQAGVHAQARGRGGSGGGVGDGGADDAMDALTGSLGALSLVPDAIRFGRGGRAGGFVPRGRGGGSVRGGGNAARGGGGGGGGVDRGRGGGALGQVPRGRGQRGRGRITMPGFRVDGPGRGAAM